MVEVSIRMGGITAMSQVVRALTIAIKRGGQDVAEVAPTPQAEVILIIRRYISCQQ